MVLEYLVSSGILEVTVKGVWSGADDTADVVTNYVARAADESLRCVLVHDHTTSNSPSLEHAFCDVDAAAPIAGDLLIAYVPYGELAVDGTWGEFLETIALNRGMKIRSFDKADEARQWLRKQLAATAADR